MSADRVEMISSSASEERLAKLQLPTTGSEDQRALLVLPQPPPAFEEGSEGDCSPESPVSWVVYLKFDADQRSGLKKLFGAKPATAALVGPQQILDLLDYDWRWEHNSPELYGRGPTGGAWQWLRNSADADRYAELAVEWSLYDDREGWEQPDADKLEGYRSDLEERLKPLGARLTGESVPAAAAADRAEELEDLRESNDMNAIIALEAPPGQTFEGRQIWDVMMSLGLRWGDMDLFHWDNPAEPGEFLFSVWTTTKPGYFLPEEIAAGRLEIQTLVFEMSVPRSVAPLQVYPSMERAAEYAQSRLGGQLTDRSHDPYDREREVAGIEGAISTLRRYGFEPGDDRTLKFF